jgi:hypothetical protein
LIKILPTTSTKSDLAIGRSKIARSVMIRIIRKCGHPAFLNEPININKEHKAQGIRHMVRKG